MKRKNNVSIYMTDDEKAIVDKAAKAEGFTLALFVRRAALREAARLLQSDAKPSTDKPAKK